MDETRLRELQRAHRRRLRIKGRSPKNPIFFQILKSAFFLIFLLALFIGIYEAGKWTIHALKTTDFFALRRVEVLGINRLTEEEVISLANLEPQKNILTIDLKEVRKRIIKNQWVEELSFRRILPGTVRIKIREKIAEILLKMDKFYFVSSDGKIIKSAEPGEDLDLPIITGVKSTNLLDIEPALRWLRNAGEKNVIPATQISELHLKSQRIIIFTTGPVMKIYGNTQRVEEQLHRLKLVLNDLHQRSIAPHQIDLNYNKKVVVKVKKSQ
ncbi:cell division protein FtsQ/DivIB [Bdellovibrionota bacterium]